MSCDEQVMAEGRGPTYLQRWSSQIINMQEKIKEKFKGLEFDSTTHSYTYKGVKLISTTNFIKRFVPAFNPTVMAKRKAEKAQKRNKETLLTAEYFQRRWRQIAQVSTLQGSRVHEFIEYNWPKFEEKPHCDQELGAINFFKKLPEHYEVLFMELRMCLPEYGRSGTADLVLLNKNTMNLVVADWKTNRKNLVQYYGTKTLKTPFNNLKDTELSKYVLQLNDYQNMLEMGTGLNVEDRWVVHLGDHDYTRVDLSKAHYKEMKLDSSIPPLLRDSYTIFRVPDLSYKLKNCYTLTI